MVTKISSETRFENARGRLSAALRDLEDATKNKIHSEAIGSRMMGVSDDVDAKIVEQEVMIQNLQLETNNLQKSLSELGRETEFLRVKNKIFADKLFRLRSEQISLIQEIESDLETIEKALEEGDEL